MGVRSAHRTDLGFSICRFSQVVFIPRAQPHAQALFLFPIAFGINNIKLIPKTIGNRKRDQFGERNERLPHLCFSICRFSQVVFIPQAQPHAQSLFLFPIVFGINLIHSFDFFREKEKRCSRKFDHLLCCFDPLSITPFDSAKNANRCEKCNVLGNGKCELSAFKEGRN